MANAAIEVLRGANAGQRFVLDDARSEWTFGRSSTGSTFQIRDEGASRQHFRIVRGSDGYAIEDLKSLNGTLLDGASIHALQPLKSGALITVCGVTLVFRDGDPSLTASVSISDRPESPVGSTLRVSLAESAEVSLASGPGAVTSERRLRAVLDIIESLRRSVDLDQIMAELLDKLLRLFPPADRGFVILFEGPGAEPVVRAQRLRVPVNQPIVLSRSVLRDVVDRREALLIQNIATASPGRWGDSVIGQLRTLVCAPLLAVDGRPLGAIQIDGSRRSPSFGEEDVRLLAAISGPLAIAIENARLHQVELERARLTRELELARRVQHNFLPQAPPRVPGFAFHHHYLSAGSIGGDYFDYIELSGGRIAVVLADVAGKGIGAALEMVRLAAEARFALAMFDDPLQAIERLNERLERVLPSGHYVTFVASILDPLTGQVEVINAGQLPPVVIDPDGMARELPIEASGFPIGMFAASSYQCSLVQLEPGASIVCFTDGVTEANNEALEHYCPRGDRRLIEAARRGAASPQQIVDELVQDLARWTGATPQSDDICIVSFGRLR